MSRIVFFLALIFVVACAQGFPLHGHLHRDADAHSANVEHDHLLPHNHTFSVDFDDAHEHSDIVEIDLLGTAISARDTVHSQVLFISTAIWVLVLTVVWVCIRRSPPAIPLWHFGPPPLLRPSPRAPPV